MEKAFRGSHPWQLDEAQALWRAFSDRTSQPSYRCAVDPSRSEMDERVRAGPSRSRRRRRRIRGQAEDTAGQ